MAMPDAMLQRTLHQLLRIKAPRVTCLNHTKNTNLLRRQIGTMLVHRQVEGTSYQAFQEFSKDSKDL